jgi:aldehyde dehydrogenase
MRYAQPGTEGAIVSFKSRYGNYIGGEFVAPVKGQYFTNTSPVNGKAIAEFPRSSAEDIDKALDAAHAAADAWGKPPRPRTRSLVLLKIADRIEQNLELLAVTETWDNGKAVRETLNADVPLAADHFRYFAGCIRAQEGSAAEINELTAAYHIHEPLGVVGQIIPWNFPLLMAAWKLAPALAAGNCIVLKPAEQTPLSHHRADGADRRPAATGRVERGARFRQGSRRGPGHQQAHRQDRFHRLHACGLAHHARGGREHHSVHRRTGRQVAEHLLRRHHAGGAGLYRKSRRRPGAGVLQPGRSVHLPVAVRWCRSRSTTTFMKVVMKKVESIKRGDPLDTDTMVGAQASEQQFDKILSYLKSPRKKARNCSPAAPWPKLEGDLATGYYIQPTLLKGTNKMRVFQEEIFGPVVGITTFKDEAEALAIANDTEFGLGAGLWTRDINRAYRMGRAIKAGRVWTNCYHLYPAHAAFGGYKKSGVGP